MHPKPYTPEYLKSLDREELEKMLLEHHDCPYRALFDSIDEGFCIAQLLFDAQDNPVDYRFLEVNPAFEQQTGFKNAAGRCISEFIPNLEQSWLDYYGRVARQRQSIRFQILSRDQDRWFDVFSFPVGDQQPDQVGIIFRDITDRHKTQEALKESEERFRALVTAGSDVVYRMSPDWREMRQLHGKNFLADTQEPNDHWMQEYIYEEDRSWVNQSIQEAIRNKKTFDLEHRVVQKDGTLGWTHSRAIPLVDHQGTIYEWFGAASDITQRKRNQQIQARAQALEAANKELESFSSFVAHDLRSPLITILGFSQMLLEDHAGPPDPEAIQYLQAIKAGALKMNNIIDFLRVLSQTSGKDMNRQPIRVDQIAHQVIKELRHEQPRQQVNVVIQDDLTTSADPDLVKILLTNLLSNSWKFTSKTRHPCIEVGRQDNEFFVSDNGPGFHNDQARKIFSPFKRAHHQNEFPGEGIGLAIVERIVRRHGGNIRVASEEGQGATFFFKLE